MDQNNLQGHYGEYVVKALCAAVGARADKPVPDRGIDWDIHAPNDPFADLPGIRIQVRTSRELPAGPVDWTFYVDRPTFDRLSETACGAPRYLVVMRTPRAVVDYVDVDHERVSFLHGLRWVSLRGMVADPNLSRNTKIPVAIPKENVLTSATLLDLCAAGVAGTAVTV